MFAVFILLRDTNFLASPSESCVPRPTTVIFFAFVRANRSIPGASRLHALQCGAQNHASVGTFDVLYLLRFTFLPVRMFVTDNDG
jgi:hypothetical protein